MYFYTTYFCDCFIEEMNVKLSSSTYGICTRTAHLCPVPTFLDFLKIIKCHTIYEIAYRSPHIKGNSVSFVV